MCKYVYTGHIYNIDIHLCKTNKRRDIPELNMTACNRKQCVYYKSKTGKNRREINDSFIPLCLRDLFRGFLY